MQANRIPSVPGVKMRGMVSSQYWRVWSLERKRVERGSFPLSNRLRCGQGLSPCSQPAVRDSSPTELQKCIKGWGMAITL